MRFGRRRRDFGTVRPFDNLLPFPAIPPLFPVTAVDPAALQAAIDDLPTLAAEPTPRKDPTVTDQFTRVDDGPQPLPLTAADPILRKLSRSGRADVLEAVADNIDPPDGAHDGTVAFSPPAASLLAAAAHVLRVLAPIERRR